MRHLLYTPSLASLASVCAMGKDHRLARLLLRIRCGLTEHIVITHWQEPAIGSRARLVPRGEPARHWASCGARHDFRIHGTAFCIPDLRADASL